MYVTRKRNPSGHSNETKHSRFDILNPGKFTRLLAKVTYFVLHLQP